MSPTCPPRVAVYSAQSSSQRILSTSSDVSRVLFGHSILRVRTKSIVCLKRSFAHISVAVEPSLVAANDPSTLRFEVASVASHSDRALSSEATDRRSSDSPRAPGGGGAKLIYHTLSRNNFSNSPGDGNLFDMTLLVSFELPPC
eukprot:3906391-Prymnesium_polylepis.2